MLVGLKSLIQYSIFICFDAICSVDNDELYVVHVINRPKGPMDPAKRSFNIQDNWAETDGPKGSMDPARRSFDIKDNCAETDGPKGPMDPARRSFNIQNNWAETAPNRKPKI